MLDAYHQKYADKPDEDLARRLTEKEKELILINNAVSPKFESDPIDIAILGCGDKRFVDGHRKIFASVFGEPVHINTFDITVDHLEGETDVYQHDCTQPLPMAPYDITFGHVVLRFIDKEKQWSLIENSFSALKPSGIAIHVLDPEDYEDTRRVDLPAIEAKLNEKGISFTKVDLPIGRAIVLRKYF